MKGDNRRQQILEFAQKKEIVMINELFNAISASVATIRRDINTLAAEGKIHKTRGKIIYVEPDRAPVYSFRDNINYDEKKLIGRKAAEMVHENDTICIDAGTTTLALAENLKDKKSLSVITNSVPVATILNNTDVHVFMPGGMLEDMCLADADTVDYLARHHVDKAFIGASGVSGCRGLTVTSPLQYSVKKQIIKSADEVYALIDSTKFHISGVNVFSEFSELTGIITARPIEDPKLIQVLEENNVKIIYVNDDLE